MAQIWTARTEQGYLYRQHGVNEQILLDFEGLSLVVKLKKMSRSKKVPGDGTDSGTKFVPDQNEASNSDGTATTKPIPEVEVSDEAEETPW